MRDFSLHILDIAENSVRAGASCVEICVEENSKVKVLIKDNGKGMDSIMIEKSQDPFFTTKNERKKKFGLGIPLLKQNVEAAGGKFFLDSKENIGTIVQWEAAADNIDTLPMGNLADTLWLLTVFYPQSEFKFEHKKEGKEGRFTSSEIREIFSGMNLSDPDVSNAIKMYVNEIENSLKSGGTNET